jgi:hypothetical protein
MQRGNSAEERLSVAQNVSIFSVNSRPYGRPWSEWTALWWKWILSIPSSRNPGNGNDIFQNQFDENVLFLAGSFGGIVDRKVAVPYGKALLFPIINFTTSYAENPSLSNERDMITEARKDMDDIVHKEATIDDNALTNIERYRFASNVFDIDYPQDNVFHARPGKTRGVSDGYWLFLCPPPRGLHKIHTIGACSRGSTRVEVTYYITVI